MGIQDGYGKEFWGTPNPNVQRRKIVILLSHNKTSMPSVTEH